MLVLRFIITGCGRSGTNYVANRLVDAGVKCGHESVFSVKGPLQNSEGYQGDSSWFAAPFLGMIAGARVLHIVREPRSVIESFHRIGLCADSRFRHFSGGRSFFSTLGHFTLNVKRIRSRLDYVNAHRNLLAEHTSCWSADNEFHRLCEYWYQWNKLIEDNVERINLPYLRLRLDEVDECWRDIADFLQIERPVVPGRATNLKTGYRSLERFQQELPEKVIDMAKRYGFKNVG
jgi:hypothetical protein